MSLPDPAPRLESPSVPRVALVTGAGSGLGRVSALALARAGWTLVLAGRRRGSLEEISADISATPGTAIVVPTDVTSPGSVDALYQKIHAMFGRLDLLFNNAGVAGPQVPVDEISAADWQRVMDTNLTGSFLVAQGAVKLMKNQQPRGGRIINNGSISAHVPRPNSAAYAASKAAITGLTKAISLDCRQYDIACGQIDIGNAATDMSADIANGRPQADGSTRPEQLMSADNIARTIVHLASLPLEANVPFLTVMANQMPYIGRG